MCASAKIWICSSDEPKPVDNASCQSIEQHYTKEVTDTIFFKDVVNETNNNMYLSKNYIIFMYCKMKSIHKQCMTHQAINWCQWRHTWLTGETEKYGPVLLPLAFIQCELHRLGLVHLALLPAWVEPRSARWRGSCVCRDATCVQQLNITHTMYTYRIHTEPRRMTVQVPATKI